MTRRLLLAATCSVSVIAGCSSQHHDPHPTVSAGDSARSVTPGSAEPASTAGSAPSNRPVIPSESTPSISSASGPHNVQPGISTTPQPTPNPAIATRTPLGAARAWATAANSSSYLDPSPGSWTLRTAPFVTGAEAAAERQQRDGGGGTTWARIQADRCITTLQQLAATVPSDAPSGPTRRIVYLTAVTTLRCATGQVQMSQFAAQLLLARVHDRWLAAEVHH